MDYQKTVSVGGDPARALETVRMVFIQQNFRIIPIDAREFEVQGPGMNNNRGNPLLAVSRGRVALSGRTLSIEAELGALRRFSRVMTLFLVGLGAFMLIVFGGLSALGLLHPRAHSVIPIKGPWILLLVLAPFSPWPFLLPMMMRGCRRNAERALETLMDNAAGVSAQ